jgi:hypothetical protein
MRRRLRRKSARPCQRFCLESGPEPIQLRGRDRLNGQPALTSEQAYVESRYRESRDQKGNLTYVAGPARLEIIADMPLVDVETGATIHVRDLIRKEDARS